MPTKAKIHNLTYQTNFTYFIHNVVQNIICEVINPTYLYIHSKQ